MPWGRVSSGSCRPKLYSQSAGSFRIFRRSPVVAAEGEGSCGLWIVVGAVGDFVATSGSATLVDCCNDDIVLQGLDVGGANADALFVFDARRNANAATEI